MKPGRGIGRVTLSSAVPEVAGARWLLVSPLSREQLTAPQQVRALREATLSRAPSPVVYDHLGAGLGDAILYVEGGEATQPFDHPMPIDAFNLAILDRISFD